MHVTLLHTIVTHNLPANQHAYYAKSNHSIIIPLCSSDATPQNDAYRLTDPSSPAMSRQPPVTKSRSKAKPLQKHQTSSVSLSKGVISQTHDSLTNILALLKSFAHRHHNQHHSSHWWRSFGLLRSAARSLAASLLRHPRRPHDEPPALVYARWIVDNIVPGAYVFVSSAKPHSHANIPC
jgi:hypothetical protein